MSIRLVILRVQRADRHEAVDGQLVQRDQVTALRIGGVALHGHQVTDVVMDGELVHDLAFAVVPLGDLAIDVQRGVSDTGLRVVLGVQGAETKLDLLVERVLQTDDGYAVRIADSNLPALIAS